MNKFRMKDYVVGRREGVDNLLSPMLSPSKSATYPRKGKKPDKLYNNNS
jgi:hypothetical protein